MTIILVCILSCGDDEIIKPIVTPSPYKNLEEKDDVLFNLELAYKNNDLTEYDKLLDDAFVFNFAKADWSAVPPKTPVQWKRDREIRSVSRMFCRNNCPDVDDPIRKMSLVLTYPLGENSWGEVDPDEQHPGETWYEKVVNYDLTIETVGGVQYFAHDFKALFIIRNAAADGDTLWRVTRWDDDI